MRSRSKPDPATDAVAEAWQVVVDAFEPPPVLDAFFPKPPSALSILDALIEIEEERAR